MKIINHKIENVNYKQTPNVSGIITPKYIVIHYTANNSFTGAINTLTNPNSKVSAHFVIGQKGELCQLAPCNVKCWHVGTSEYKGLTGLNAYSIGLELCNFGPLSLKNGEYYSWNGKIVSPSEVYTDTTGKHWNAYTHNQLTTTIDICKALISQYKTIVDVVGHSDLAMPRGRKQDPSAAFPMEFLRCQLFNRTQPI